MKTTAKIFLDAICSHITTGGRRLPNDFRAKFSLPLCAVALAAGAFCSPLLKAAPAAQQSTTQAAISVAYDAINAAFDRRDLPSMMSYFTTDYIDIDEKGVWRGKDQERSDYEKRLGQIKTIQSRYTIDSLTPTATGILVEMHLHSSGIGEKRVLFAKLHGAFTNDLRVRDLWMNTPQGWRLQHRQTIQNDLKVHPW